MNRAADDSFIDIWYGNIEPAEKISVQHYEQLLDADERIRMGKFSNGRLRRQYLCVRGQLRELLSQYTQTRAQELQFAREDFGKPYLPDHPDIVFNMSHSGDKMAVAVANQGQLGIDIESWRRTVNFSGLISKCFADEERQFWHATPDDKKTAVFYELWTKKEAFVKAVGRGIALGLDQCVVSSEHPGKYMRVPHLYGPVTDWRIFTLPLGDEISGAVSVRSACHDIKMHFF